MDGRRKLTPGERDAFLARMEAKYADEEVSYIGTPAEVSQPDTPARVQGRTPGARWQVPAIDTFDRLEDDDDRPPSRAGIVAALRELEALRPAWHRDAACRDVEGVNFFPERGESTKPAKAVCATCPTIDECRAYMLAEGIREGIWAGESARTLKRRSRAA